MPTAFDRAFNRTGLAEGLYSNHRADRGGPTKFGITERVARANGYMGEMRDLPIEEARRIARLQYWNLLFLDEVAGVSEPLAAELFDTGFNMGLPFAARSLQRWLNALNKRQSFYGDLEADGVLGPVTVAALRHFAAVRGREGLAVLLVAVNCSQGERYLGIVEANETQEDFVFGWLKNRVAL